MRTQVPVPSPADEERRLATLDDYALLDSPSEAIFDSLTALAAHMCATPFASIALIGRDRQWFKASVGWSGVHEIARDVAFSAQAILAEGITEVPDAPLDARFCDDPLVMNDPQLRFYAGAPLTVAGGQTLGMLCVLDRYARSLSSEQRGALSMLAAAVVEQFELRRARLHSVRNRQNERLAMLTEVARSLLRSFDAGAFVDAVVHGVAQLCKGATAQLLARGAGMEFVATRDFLGRRETAAANDDEFVRAAAEAHGVLLRSDGRRAGVPIRAPSGFVSYLLDVHSGVRRFDNSDEFVFGLLGQYLAVAIHNVELYGELASQRTAVVELNQVKNDLIAMLAHDFKGPLTTIVGLADVLAEDERFDAESRELLGMINSSAMRLASLATDTLALSRLEQTALSLRFDRVDMVALLRDVVRVFSVTRGIDMRSAIDVLIVRADAARLRQVLENLIGNAIKYSPRGEPVDVLLREKHGGVEIAIRDRGIGIPAADLPKLFGRFARGSNARELGIGGTGFGLYLSRTIVEMHGGTIAVESRPGQGSTFRVFVPSVPAPQRTLDRRVVLLDSQDDERSFIAPTLRDAGYAVLSVAGEGELLAALEDCRYDAAIVDVDRLVMSVDELVEQIAHRTTLVRLGSTDESDSTGWNAALRKPFLIKDLQVVLESAIGERRRLPRE